MVSQKHSDESLFDVLKKKDPSLASQLDKIKKSGVEDWIGLLHSDKGSYAGYPHLLDVERIADKIIPDRLKYEFTAGELFLLLSAIFLHDIGRTIPFPGPKTPCRKGYGETCDGKAWGVKIPDENEEYDEDKHPPCRKPQWDHHYESERIIRDYGMALGLPDERIAQYCGLIAFCHCLTKPPIDQQGRFPERYGFNCWEKQCSNFRTTSLAPYGVLRIPLLAAILRIADETDNLWTRAVREYWRRRLTKSSVNLGKAFRRYIEDIEFSHEGECLIVHVAELVDSDEEHSLGLSDEDLVSIRGAIESMREVITSGWGRLLQETIGVRFREVYIEHANHLYTEFNPKLTPALGMALEKEMKSSLKGLFYAATTLALGSFGHSAFTWQTLEAQVGRPLTDSDKWLALRMGSATSDFRVMGDLDGEELYIELEDRGKISTIREAILGRANDVDE